MNDENKRRCNECGEVKSDVEFRTWDGIDAAEWDILCASCAKKKEREMKYFWRCLIIFIVACAALFTLVAYGFLISAVT